MGKPEIWIPIWLRVWSFLFLQVQRQFYLLNKEVSGYPFSSRTGIDGRLLKVRISQKQFFLRSILQKIDWIRKVLIHIIIPIRGYLSGIIKCFYFLMNFKIVLTVIMVFYFYFFDESAAHQISDIYVKRIEARFSNF